MRTEGWPIERLWFRHTLGWKETNGGVVPLRFTAEQLEVYEPIPVYRTRSLSPAGLILDVMTDAAELTLEVERIHLVRPYCYFDLYLQDTYIESVGEQGDEPGIRRYTFRLQPQTDAWQRVTVYLPHNAELILRKVEWTFGARIEPAPHEDRNLLCLGDSITQGMDAVHPSFTYPVLLARRLGMNLINQGVGGYHFNADSLASGLSMHGFTPDLITVAYGTNDWGKWQSLEELSDRIQAYLKRLTSLYPSSRIYVLTPFWRVDWQEPKPMGTFQELEDIMAKACSLYPGMRLILGTELFPHDAGLLADKVHPKQEGFRILAETLANRVTS